MNDTLKKVGAGVGLVAAFALGGAAVAGAVQNNSAAPAAATTTTPTQPPPARGHHHGGGRPDETALSGQTAEKVRAAALARVSGGTIERLETDADGNAAYEAHMRRANGTPVTVYVNEQFQVVKVEDGR